MLFLILAFFNAAGLFVLMGAEFLAMILVIVYVGAVAVLFLFVVMMLDIDFVELRSGFLRYLPIGALIGLILLAELVLVVRQPGSSAPGAAASAPAPLPPEPTVTNTQRSGACSIPDYVYLLPGGRPDPAGRHDRRHRADPAPARGRAPPVDRARRSAAARAEIGRGQEGADAASGRLMHGRSASPTT